MPTRFFLLACVFVMACAHADSPTDTKQPTDTTQGQPTTLRQLIAARGGRFVGGATGQLLTRSGALGDNERQLAGRELNMLWSGNFLKFSVLRPTRGTYAYANAD